MKKIVSALGLAVCLVTSVFAQEHAVSEQSALKLGTSLTQLQKRVQDLRQQNSELEAKIQNMPDEINVLREKLSGLQAQAQDMLQALSKIEGKDQNRVTKIKMLEKQLLDWHGQIDLVQNEKNMVIAQVQKKIEQQHKINDKMNEIKMELLRLQNEALIDVDKAIDEKVDVQRMTMTKLLNEKMDLIDVLIARLDTYRKQKDLPQRQYQLLQQEQVRLKQYLNDLEEGRISLDFQVEEAKIMASGVKHKKIVRLDHEIEEMKSQKEMLRKRLEIDRNEKASKEAEIVPNLAKMSKLEKNISTLERQNKLLEDEFRNLRMQMIELDKEKARLERLVKAYQKMGF